MADKKYNVHGGSSRSVVPFTGGILMLAYAFFWPAQYGAWLGLIVKSFRSVAGF